MDVGYMCKHFLFSVLIIFTAFWGVNALERQALVRFAFSEPHMGTMCNIILYAADEATAQKAAKEAFARIGELDAIMSDYQSDSELMKLCKEAGRGPVPVSADLFKVLEAARTESSGSLRFFNFSASSHSENLDRCKESALLAIRAGDYPRYHASASMAAIQHMKA